MAHQPTTDIRDNALGPMAHLESWSNNTIIVFACAHFTLNSEWQKAHKNFLQWLFHTHTPNSAQVPQINPTAVGLKNSKLILWIEPFATSASLAAVALHNAIVPLLPSFRTEDVCTAKVEHTWMTGNGANAVENCHKMHLPTCDDPSNKELFLCIVDQFLDAAHNKWLKLSAGASRCAKFWDIIGGDSWIVWQEISVAWVAKTIDCFMDDIGTLIGCCFAPVLHQDQLEHLRMGTELFQMTCEQLGSHLCVINHLGHCLPGSVVGGCWRFTHTVNDWKRPRDRPVTVTAEDKIGMTADLII